MARISSAQVEASAIGSAPPSLQYRLRLESIGASRRICLTIASACDVRFRSATRATTWWPSHPQARAEEGAHKKIPEVRKTRIAMNLPRRDAPRSPFGPADVLAPAS